MALNSDVYKLDMQIGIHVKYHLSVDTGWDE
jgi:hypothetical protein